MGFGTNTDEMARVAGALRAAAGEAGPKIKDLEGAVNGGAKLGSAHVDAATKYQEGLRRLVTAANSFATATNDFAGRLEKTKGGYQWVENNNTRTVGGK
ncbi:WXG100 family type VII secretion target [Allokutzneria albata]|uniref:Excreted virulence factor EspC, type VII ESX diderm n=1 Tax=Allokutzneria albata TaxID=211114 RepID=A0A1G9YWP3_ALLAB|nr:hypothetical protein [Allokutzneria albata]SDN13579.1 hypothetical protein SAMN04489726_5106 [Allokutzneria albata]